MQPDEDRIVRLLADGQNRAVLAALTDADGPLPVADLAERLVCRGETVVDSDDYDRELDRMEITLHHNRLPKLAEAGLIEYDRDANVVTPREDPAVDPEWLDVERLDELLERFRTDRDADEESLGVIEGRENVIEYGRRLADEAEDELFLLYVSDDLIEEECLDRARDALDRGVDIDLGSPDPGLRDLARTHLPDVELWEPQFDWMNDPSAKPKVARLVLADRDKVLLGMLLHPEGDQPPTERAVVGRGEANPLVRLVRDLLGPRIDHLDYQSEEFRSQLPFET